MVAALFLTSCASGPGDADAVAEDAVEAQIDAEGQSTAPQPVELIIPEVPGAPLNRFDLQIGDCFNEGSWFDDELDRRIELTATVDCGQPHQSEVYFDGQFPAPAGAQFPGDSAMTEWSTQLCYDEFEAFVGLMYELSAYEIGFVQPNRDTFEHPVGLHRRVLCFVSDVSGSNLTGSAKDSGV